MLVNDAPKVGESVSSFMIEGIINQLTSNTSSAKV